MNLHKKKVIKYGSLTQDTVEIRTELMLNLRLSEMSGMLGNNELLE